MGADHTTNLRYSTTVLTLYEAHRRQVVLDNLHLRLIVLEVVGRLERENVIPPPRARGPVRVTEPGVVVVREESYT